MYALNYTDKEIKKKQFDFNIKPKQKQTTTIQHDSYLPPGGTHGHHRPKSSNFCNTRKSAGSTKPQSTTNAAKQLTKVSLKKNAAISTGVKARKPSDYKHPSSKTTLQKKPTTSKKASTAVVKTSKARGSRQPQA